MSTPDGSPPDRPEDHERTEALAQALGEPPRSLPWGLVCRLRLGLPVVIGSAVFGFGMIFWWIFAEPSLPFEDWQLDKHAAEAPGTVTAVQATGIREDHSRVYRYRFTFRPPQGPPIRGVCHWTGVQQKPGDPVFVQYLPQHPDVCRIKGMRRGVCSAWAALIGLVPLGGFVAIMVGLLLGRLRVNMLRNGCVQRLTLTDVRSTHTQINRQMVMKYVFESTDVMGQPAETACRTHLPTGLTPGHEAWVVYDPGRPIPGLLLKLLADQLVLDDFRQLTYKAGPMDVLRLLVPAVCITPHVAIWLIRLL